MKPIIPVTLLVLICVSARIQFANARLEFPLNKLKSLILEKRDVDKGESDSDSSGNDTGDMSNSSFDSSESDESSPNDQSSHQASQNSGSSLKSNPNRSGPGSSSTSGSTTSSPSHTGSSTTHGSGSQTSLAISGTSSMPAAIPTAPPGSSGSASHPCPSGGGSGSSGSGSSGGSQSGEHTGIISNMEHRVQSFLAGVVTGVRAKIHAIKHFIARQITRLVTIVYKLVVDPLGKIFSPITRFFAWLRSCFDGGVSMGKTVYEMLPDNSSEVAAEVHKRSVRAISDISVPMTVSANDDSLWGRFEELVQYMEHTSPKERERYKRIIWVVWCLLRDWLHYDTCDDQTAKNLREFYAQISSQATLKNITSWVDSHVDALVKADIISRDKALLIHTICQTIELLLSLNM